MTMALAPTGSLHLPVQNHHKALSRRSGLVCTCISARHLSWILFPSFPHLSEFIMTTSVTFIVTIYLLVIFLIWLSSFVVSISDGRKAANMIYLSSSKTIIYLRLSMVSIDVGMAISMAICMGNLIAEIKELNYLIAIAEKKVSQRPLKMALEGDPAKPVSPEL